MAKRKKTKGVKQKPIELQSDWEQPSNSREKGEQTFKHKDGSLKLKCDFPEQNTLTDKGSDLLNTHQLVSILEHTLIVAKNTVADDEKSDAYVKAYAASCATMQELRVACAKRLLVIGFPAKEEATIALAMGE